jgi:hypothetical protein
LGAVALVIRAAFLIWQQQRPTEDDSLLHKEEERRIAAEFRQMELEEDSFRLRKHRLEARFEKYWQYFLHILA